MKRFKTKFKKISKTSTKYVQKRETSEEIIQGWRGNGFQQTTESANLSNISQGAGAAAETQAAMTGSLKETLAQLRLRATRTRLAISEFSLEEDWIVAQTFFGVTTRYKPGDQGSIWIRLDGDMNEASLFNQLAVVRETGLFCQWVPFCNKSKALCWISGVELVTTMNIYVPPLNNRDAVIHAFAVDCLYEHNAIVLIGNSVDSYPNVEIPPCKGFGCARMDIKGFKAMIRVTGPASATTSIVVNVDPKMPLPQVLLNFVMKKMAGVLLWCLQKEACKIGADKSHPHAVQTCTDPFYKEWLLPRLARYFRLQGWEMPCMPLMGWDPSVDRSLSLDTSVQSEQQNSTRESHLQHVHCKSDSRSRGMTEKLRYCFPKKVKMRKSKEQEDAQETSRLEPPEFLPHLKVVIPPLSQTPQEKHDAETDSLVDCSVLCTNKLHGSLALLLFLFCFVQVLGCAPSTANGSAMFDKLCGTHTILCALGILLLCILGPWKFQYARSIVSALFKWLALGALAVLLSSSFQRMACYQSIKLNLLVLWDKYLSIEDTSLFTENSAEKTSVTILLLFVLTFFFPGYFEC